MCMGKACSKRRWAERLVFSTSQALCDLEAGPDSGSTAVMLLLQQIIGDAKVLQAKAETDFEAAVKDYKQFKDDATVAITTKAHGMIKTKAHGMISTA